MTIPTRHAKVYLLTERISKNKRAKKTRKAFPEKLYLKIFIFLSLNYVTGVLFGFRKSRCLAVSRYCLQFESHIFDKIGVELEALRVS